MMRRGMLSRVVPIDHSHGIWGSGWFAYVSEASDGEEDLAYPVCVTSLHGDGELFETRIEPRLRCSDGQQARDGRMFGLADFFVGLPKVLRQLLAGSDADDFDRDVHVNLGARQLDHPVGEI